MSKFLLIFLLAPALTFAQDDCSDCAKGCDDCATETADAESSEVLDCFDAKPTIALATARKDLSTWRTELRGLSRIERDSIKSASKAVFAKDVNAKALAPTFGATADLLAILARVDTGAARNAAALSASYRAMAQAIAGKKSYPAQPMTNAKEMKAAMVKAQKDAKAAQALWASAKTTKLSDDDAKLVADSLKVLNAGCPRMRALAVNVNSTGAAIKSVKLSDEAPDGDPAGAMLKTIQSLHASTAPFFAKVTLEKPEVMAPAPST